MATVQETKPAEDRLVLYSIPWQTYEKLLDAFDGRRLRITYDRGQLEIMTLSFEHERLNRLFDRLVDTLCEEMNIAIGGAGSMTFKRERKQRGLQPDECYWIQNEEAVRDIVEYDPEIHPPPDLVIEVDVASSSLNRIGIYEAMGVNEVWRWDGKNLEVRVLDNSGKYRIRKTSAAFPRFKPVEMIAFLDVASTHGELEMVKAFRKWIRERHSNDD